MNVWIVKHSPPNFDNTALDPEFVDVFATEEAAAAYVARQFRPDQFGIWEYEVKE